MDHGCERECEEVKKMFPHRVSTYIGKGQSHMYMCFENKNGRIFSEHMGVKKWPHSAYATKNIRKCEHGRMCVNYRPTIAYVAIL